MAKIDSSALHGLEQEQRVLAELILEHSRPFVPPWHTSGHPFGQKLVQPLYEAFRAQYASHIEPREYEAMLSLVHGYCGDQTSAKRG